MPLFRDAPIRVKLSLIVITVVGAAMMVSSFALTLHDFGLAKQHAIAQVSKVADLIGSNTTAALSFQRPDAAEDALKGLRLEESVVFGCVYDQTGAVFALYRTESSQDWPAPPRREKGHTFNSQGALELYNPILQDGELLGTIFLTAGMDRFYAPLWFRVVRRFIVMTGALVLGILLASRLHRTISGPIARLLETTRTISASGDYLLRVPKDSDDELGKLCDEFNTMVAHIQERELELMHHRENLENIVQERTASLEAKTQELARSNAELELFASVASHDLQEPLRMVSSYVELLAQRYRDQVDDKAKRWITFAVDGAARMKQLINDLLEFSRVGTRGKPFEPTETKVVLDKVLTNLQRAIADKGAQVTVGPLPTVVADATQLGQLFQNLIGNAIKFCSEQQPEVSVEATRDGAAWRFAVRDNGIGIDPQFAERIFIIFQRLHTREQYSGTGIGLAVCKKIVERHGGRIWVESQLGQGAAFFFTLPDRMEADHGHERTGQAG